MSLKIKGDVISSGYISGSPYIKTNLAAPIMVAFDITNKCNFKCLHCFNHSGEDLFPDELSDTEKLNVVEQIIELKPFLVCLCGGETTCCKVLLQIIEKLSPVVPSINMVSNGYLIDKEFALKLKKAGVSAVQISLDGINAEQHDTFRGHYGAFEHAINAMKSLREVGLPILTSLVPNKLNYLDTYKYFELCEKMGVLSARCMPFLPMGRGQEIGNNLILNDDEYYIFYNQLLQAKNDFPNLTIEWGDPIDHTYRLPNNASLGLDTYSMDIRSNGDIGVSAYFPIVVGNCKKHTLKEYWDAGYNHIWNDKRIREMMNEITTIPDFNKLSNMKEYKTDIYKEDK